VLELLYLHGLGDTPEPSRPFLEHLADRIGADRVSMRSPDFREVAEWTGPCVTLEAAAGAIARSLGDGEGPPAFRRPTLLIGHSVGAQVGVATVRHICSLRGFVAVEGAMFASVASPFQRYASEKLDGRGRARLIEDLEALESPGRRERAYLRAVRRTDGRWFDSLARELVDRWKWAREGFERLDAPRLYVAGAESVGDDAVRWVRSIDSGPVDAAVVEDAGHNPHYAQPVRVADLCRRWGERRGIWT